LQLDKAGDIKGELKSKIDSTNEYNYLAQKIELGDSKAAKSMLFELEKELGAGIYALGLVSNGKPQLMIMISKSLVESKGWHAGKLVKESAAHINGGGGGQPFFATAGGSKVEGLEAALASIKEQLV